MSDRDLSAGFQVGQTADIGGGNDLGLSRLQAREFVPEQLL